MAQKKRVKGSRTAKAPPLAGMPGGNCQRHVLRGRKSLIKQILGTPGPATPDRFRFVAECRSRDNGQQGR